MSYEQIDPVLDDWANTHGLTIDKEYKEFEVRSVSFYTGTRGGYQIWVDQPDQTGLIGIHVWDRKRIDRGGRLRDFLVSHTELREYLESAFTLAKGWLNK